MSLVRVNFETGRPGGRLYVAGHRCHHGMAGALLALLGLVLCWHDHHDFPWLSDRDAFRVRR